MAGSHSSVKGGRWRIIAQKVIYSIISPLSALQVVFLDELVCILVEVTCSFISLQEWCLLRFKKVSRFTKLVGQILKDSNIAKVQKIKKGFLCWCFQSNKHLLCSFQKMTRNGRIKQLFISYKFWSITQVGSELEIWIFSSFVNLEDGGVNWKDLNLGWNT